MIILLLFCFFWFNRGYYVDDRLDFALTVIKRLYNTNDRLKFILSIIRRDNSLNKRLKHVKKRKKRKSKVNEMKMKANKTRNELKFSDSNTYRLKNEERTKNDEERRKIFTDLLTEMSRKHYGSTSTRFFFTKTCFFTQNS